MHTGPAGERSTEGGHVQRKSADRQCDAGLQKPADRTVSAAAPDRAGGEEEGQADQLEVCQPTSRATGRGTRHSLSSRSDTVNLG